MKPKRFHYVQEGGISLKTDGIPGKGETKTPYK